MYRRRHAETLSKFLLKNNDTANAFALPTANNRAMNLFRISLSPVSEQNPKARNNAVTASANSWEMLTSQITLIRRDFERTKVFVLEDQ